MDIKIAKRPYFDRYMAFSHQKSTTVFWKNPNSSSVFSSSNGRLCFRQTLWKEHKRCCNDGVFVIWSLVLGSGFFSFCNSCHVFVLALCNSPSAVLGVVSLLFTSGLSPVTSPSASFTVLACSLRRLEILFSQVGHEEKRLKRCCSERNVKIPHPSQPESPPVEFNASKS